MQHGRGSNRPHRRLVAEVLAVATVIGGLAWWLGAEPEESARPVEDAIRPRTPTPARPFAERRPAPVSDAVVVAPSDTGAPELDSMVDAFAAEWDGLVCRVSQDVGVPNASLIIDGAFDIPMPAGVFGDRLLGPDLFSYLEGATAGTGTFFVDGFAPTPFSWVRDGDQYVCVDDPVALLEADAGVVGYVRNAEGLPEGRVWVTGCGTQTTTDEEGAFFLPAGAGTCTVQGFRQDGFWQSRTERVEVTLEPGEDVEVDLTLPERPRGGVGVAIRPGDDGVVIGRVHPGGAAWDAGIEAGSIVLEIEGEPYDPWDLDGFIDLVTGEAGTDVELTLLTPDGQEDVVILERRAMGPTGS